MFRIKAVDVLKYTRNLILILPYPTDLHVHYKGDVSITFITLKQQLPEQSLKTQKNICVFN